MKQYKIPAFCIVIAAICGNLNAEPLKIEYLQSASISESPIEIAEVTIQMDDYAEALQTIGFTMSSLDARPMNPITGKVDPDYHPPQKFIEAIPSHQFAFFRHGKNKRGIKRDYLFYVPDPYGFSENTYGLKNVGYITNQQDYSAEIVNSGMFHDTSTDASRTTSVFATAQVEGNDDQIYVIREPLIISSDLSGVFATFGDKFVFLKRNDGGDISPATNEDYELVGNQILVEVIDNDGDGYHEQFVVAINGVLYFYNFSEMKDNNLINASYQIRIASSAVEGHITMEAGDVVGTTGEELLVLGTTYRTDYFEGQAPWKHTHSSKLRVISIGGTNYSTLYTRDALDDGESFEDDTSGATGNAYTTFTLGHFVPNDDHKQIAFGRGYVNNKTYGRGQKLSVAVWRFDNNADGNINNMTRLGYFNKTKSYWKAESIFLQNSIAAADLHGIGVDYIAFADSIYAYNPDRSNKLDVVANFNLGRDSTQKMVWTTGQFSDDVNDYISDNITEVVPTAHVTPRKEGEELVLAYIDVKSSGFGDPKFRVQTYRLIDIDTASYLDLRTLDGGFYGTRGGVHDDSFLHPQLLNTSNITVPRDDQYSYTSPAVGAYDIKKVSTTMMSTGGHSLTFSAPVLTHVLDVIPYYEAIKSTQNPLISILFNSDSSVEFTQTTSTSTALSFEVSIPSITLGLSNSMSDSETFGGGKNYTETFSYTNPADSPFILIDITPYDSYQYEIVNTPYEIRRLIGTQSNILIPRKPLMTPTTLNRYNAINNDELNGKLFHYDHLFSSTPGVPSSYPNRSNIEEEYTDPLISETHTINRFSSGNTTVALGIGEYTSESTGESEDLSFSVDIGIEYGGFGFSQSLSFASGLETTNSRTMSQYQGFSGSVFGFDLDDTQAPYAFGIFMTEDTNPKNARDEFIRGGFYVQ